MRFLLTAASQANRGPEGNRPDSRIAHGEVIVGIVMIHICYVPEGHIRRCTRSIPNMIIAIVRHERLDWLGRS